MAGNCQKLKFNRQRLGLSQIDFAKLVGVSPGTIYRLEKDETAWAVTRSSTIDKIMEHYASMASYQPDRAEERRRVLGLIEEPEIEETVDEEEEETVEPKPEVVEEVEEPVHNDDSDSDLTDKDKQLLKYIEFTCDNLKSSKSHEEFVTGIDILKRIIKNQY